MILVIADCMIHLIVDCMIAVSFCNHFVFNGQPGIFGIGSYESVSVNRNLTLRCLLLYFI